MNSVPAQAEGEAFQLGHLDLAAAHGNAYHRIRPAAAGKLHADRVGITVRIGMRADFHLDAPFRSQPQRVPDIGGVLPFADEPGDHGGIAGVPLIGMGERPEKVQGDAFRRAADKGTAHAPDARHARRMRAGRAGHDRAEGIEQAQQPCGLRAGGPAGRAMRHGTISNNSMKPTGAPPLEPRQRRCLCTLQGASRAGRGEPLLDPTASRRSKRLMG